VDKVEVVLDLAVVLILLGAGLHLYQSRQVLEQDGCEAYWTEFKGGYEGQLVNETEAEWFQEYGSTRPPSIQENLSTGFQNLGDNSVKKR